MDRFVNLHVHDCFNSLLDAISRPEEIVNFAKENGQKAVAFTGHGSMASFILQAKCCRQAGVKPIFGCEVYEVDDMWKKESTKDHPEQRNHLILLAKNQDGFQNLLKIVSLAGTEGRYIKPRIDINEIQKNNWGDGIIALTACMAGRMSRYAEQNNIEEMSSWYDTLTETFDDAYVELQSHGVEEQRILNNKLIDFVKREDIKDHFVITSDAHMINDSDRDIHRMFVATGQSREVGETYKDCYMQTEKSMRNIMEQQIGKGAVNASILNMKHLVDQIEDIDVGLDNDTLMPIFEYPEEFDSSLDYLKYLIKEGLKEKHKTLGIDVKEYSKRVKTELDVIVELGYVDYFLIMYMLIHKAQKRGIPLGYGRGSAGGCLILYLIGVTQVDSIKWDLDFSRFANLGRKGSMADIDLDMSKRRRKEMINIAEDLFGKDKVCAVSTFNTMTMKVAIRDVGKVMDEQEDSIYKGQIPYSIRDKAAKLMPEILLEDDKGIKISKQEGFINAIKTNGELYDIYMEFPKWFEYALALDGLPKSRGKNASAIIISPKPITYYASLCLDRDGEPIFEPEMHALMDDIQLVKFDFLGLKTLDVVDDTLKFSHLTWEDVDINHLDLEDKDVFDNIFKNGNTVGIFQTESAEARNMCIQAKCDNVEDIVVVNSANRPGTKDQFPDYCKNKLNPDQIVVVHPDMKEIFKQSHSVMMYQEQALALLRYAGFDEKETDVGRRAIGKKKIDVMKTLEVKFKKGLKDKEWTDEQANETWDLMVKQSGYSFNRSHAVAYSLLSYLTGYLKYHYQESFMAACLISAGDGEKVSQYISDMKTFGVELSPPDINLSGSTFTPDPEHHKIYYGINDINSIKSTTFDTINDLRPFKSYQDYINRTLDLIDKTSQIMLIKSGAFTNLTTANRTRQFKYLWQERFLAGKEQLKPIKKVNKTHIQKLLEGGVILSSEQNDKELCLEKFNRARKIDGWNEFENKYLEGNELNWEMDSLNTFISGDPFEGVVLPNWDNVVKDNIGHVGGVITSRKVNTVKKGKSKGQKMGFINLETKYGIIDIVVFADQWKKFGDLLTFGNTVVIGGLKTGDKKCTLNKAYSLNEYLIKTSKCQLKK